MTLINQQFIIYHEIIENYLHMEKAIQIITMIFNPNNLNMLNKFCVSIDEN